MTNSDSVKATTATQRKISPKPEAKQQPTGSGTSIAMGVLLIAVSVITIFTYVVMQAMYFTAYRNISLYITYVVVAGIGFVPPIISFICGKRIIAYRSMPEKDAELYELCNIAIKVFVIYAIVATILATIVGYSQGIEENANALFSLLGVGLVSFTAPFVLVVDIIAWLTFRYRIRSKRNADTAANACK